jgi:hypothetical protein
MYVYWKLFYGKREGDLNISGTTPRRREKIGIVLEAFFFLSFFVQTTKQRFFEVFF